MMKKTRSLSIVLLSFLALPQASRATTTLWLPTNSDGTPLANDSLAINVGDPITLYAFMNTTETFSGFELFVGYDTSDATKQGIGKDTNNGASQNVTLASSSDEIKATISSIFPANRYANLDASAREASNAYLGGRPYGIQVSATVTQGSSTAIGDVRLFSFTLDNNLDAGESQYVVISDNGSGASYTSWLALGGTTYRDGYALSITATAVPEPITLAMMGFGGILLARRRRA